MSNYILKENLQLALQIVINQLEKERMIETVVMDSRGIQKRKQFKDDIGMSAFEQGLRENLKALETNELTIKYE